MNNYVYKYVLSGGEKLIIIWSDKTETEAEYIKTIGYNHYFKTLQGKEIKLSNHFMRLKAIKINLI
ncbi:hypothetical protein LJB90_01705 [Eubacteriales bacterium OttesenSCG-928-G02]|nr:hypothetical protein [Eubacteriales bacterium OttesenSCG-928-G02]